MFEVLHAGIGAGEEQGLVVRILPTDHVRGSSLCATHFENLTIPIRLTDVMTPDDDSITDCCYHFLTPSSEPSPVGRWKRNGMWPIEAPMRSEVFRYPSRNECT